MNIGEIEHKIACNELSAAQVFTQMKQHVDAATGLCAIYFTIAEESIGEDRVRELRDAAIEALHS